MNLRKLIHSIFLPLLLFFSFVTFAQNKTITGRVTDAAGKGIGGVSVSAKGQSSGTVTNDNGAYSLAVPADATTLVFSSVGYAVQEVPVSGTTADVILASNTTNLNEVVVVAYGTRRRGDLTGAVTSVTAKDFQKGNIASADQLIQGKVAGLQITSGGGSAGGGSKIRIRGGASFNSSNDPLIVIDGIPIESNGISGSGNFLNTINPNDIESMSVLKDASATALYGSRASNGVIIITTKKGGTGKIKFNYNALGSVGVVTKKLDVLSADEIRTIVNAQAAKTGNNQFKNLLGTSNTNWQDEIYQRAPGFDNTLSANGSIARKVPFRASAGYYNQDGILKTDNFQRLSSSLNLSPKLFTDHLAVNINLKYAQTKNRFANSGAVGAAAYFDPTQPVTANNKYGGYFEWLDANGIPSELAPRNPLALLELRDNRSTVNRLLSSISLDYKLHFFPDLHVLVNLGYDYAKGRGNDVIDSAFAGNYKDYGRVTPYRQKKKNALADIQLFYAKDLKSINSKIDVLLGHTYQAFETGIYNFAAYSQRGGIIAGTQQNNATDKLQNRLESYLGRINLTVNNKYLFTASVRRDASSKFSPINRVGYFPALAAAWKLKEEFFSSNMLISELKLRMGYGVTGQQDFGDLYGYLPYYSLSNTTAQYQLGNTYYSLYRPSAYDVTRKWESTATSNIALDFGLFNNRVSGSVDLYLKKTKDLLSIVPIAPGANFNIQLLTNIGRIEGRGVEFNINTTPVKTKDLNWDIGFNMAYNKVEITKLLSNPDPNFKGIDVSGISGGTGNFIGKFLVGQAPFTFFAYKQIYDKNGNPIEGLYEDMNRDGVLDNNDRHFYKKPAPDLLLGASTQITYKQLTVSATAHGMTGNYLYNNVASNSGVLRNIQNPVGNLGNVVTNYYSTLFANNQYLSNYYIQNASFVRIDNINLGYNFGRVWSNKAALRVNASVQNPFVFTKYKGLDPENSNDTGLDQTIYPRPRIYSLGFNLDF